MYKLVGSINSFKDIPFDKQVIISGSIDGTQSWFHRVPGIFRKDNDDYRFVDDHGMASRFRKETPLSLNVLEREYERECEQKIKKAGVFDAYFQF